jgi:hypothetical protein
VFPNGHGAITIHRADVDLGECHPVTHAITPSGTTTASAWRCVIWTDPCSCGLKQQSGDILMHGFGPVAQTLTANGLLDALHLWVHPHFADVGTTSDMLFSEGNNTRLKLIETRTSTPASSCFLTRWPTPNAPT